MSTIRIPSSAKGTEKLRMMTVAILVMRATRMPPGLRGEIPSPLGTISLKEESV
jgi:hypothetical protein